MSAPSSHRRSKLLSLGGLRRPSSSLQPLAGPHSPISPASLRGRTSYDDRDRDLGRSPSPNYSDPFTSTHGHERDMDDLPLPTRPYTDRPGSGLSSRRSSVDSGKDGKERPASLSINYVPSKFTKLHAQGDYAHRRAKVGGGRDAFGRDAQRMGMMGTVDDDEGVVFQLGKGGLKKKKPKLRWNRFKWVLFVANTVLIAYGIAFLIASILVWLNVFYQSDVIRVGNRTELILSTTAAALITLTALIGYSGIILNNRAFLAVYTFLLWACLALMVAPGYIAYKKKSFNLEGKINYQWSRDLHTEGRLRVQNALRCCGYFSPFVEATQSPLCYARSNLPGCKNRYLKLERHVLTTWFTIAFSLVPAHLLIMVSALLCSNHITYRFGKGLTPKRYRLDLGSMAVIMDEYASQIAAQYGPQLANEAFNRSSTNLDPNVRHSLSVPASRSGSSSNLAAMGMASSTSGGLTRPTSRFNPAYGAPSSTSTGYSSQAGRVSMYDPSTDGLDGSRRGAARVGSGTGTGTTVGSAGESRYNDTETDAGASTRYGGSEDEYAQGYGGQQGQYAQPGAYGHQAGQYDQHAHGWAR